MFRGTVASIALVVLIYVVQSSSEEQETNSVEIENLLERGRRMLATGQMSQALEHYDNAVALDPSDHLNYFRRAVAYKATNRAKDALADLSRSLELSPYFVGALLQRGILLVKLGRFIDAFSDLDLAAQLGDSDAQTLLTECEELISLSNVVDELQANDDLQELIEVYSQLLDAAPLASDLLQARADAYLRDGEPMRAVADLHAVTRILADSTDLFARISLIFYEHGHLNESLNEIRQCLKLDQDHVECKSEYRRLKALSKLLETIELGTNDKNWTLCLTAANQLRNQQLAVRAYQLHAELAICRCSSRMATRGARDAIRACSNVLSNFDATNTEALLNRADAYVALLLPDDAIKDYQTVLELERTNARAKAGVKLAKRSKEDCAAHRDYYKIIGVDQNANKREITKAYRKMALEWHPDNFQDVLDRKIAERKFIDIMAAKEVLGDQFKRNVFDQGVDPLDPTFDIVDPKQTKTDDAYDESFHCGISDPFDVGNSYHYKVNYN